MKIPHYIVDFLNRHDVQECLANDNFQELYSFAYSPGTPKYWSFTADLTKLLMEAGVDFLSHMEAVPDACFYGLGMEDVSIPDCIKRIHMFAFKECTCLKNIDIPDSVTKIDRGAFEGCESLTKIRLPSYLEQIPFRCFRDCKNLKSVDIPLSLEYIDSEAFIGCGNLTRILYEGTKEQWSLVDNYKGAFYRGLNISVYRPLIVVCADGEVVVDTEEF